VLKCGRAQGMSGCQTVSCYIGHQAHALITCAAFGACRPTGRVTFQVLQNPGLSNLKYQWLDRNVTYLHRVSPRKHRVPKPLHCKKALCNYISHICIAAVTTALDIHINPCLTDTCSWLALLMSGAKQPSALHSTEGPNVYCTSFCRVGCKRRHHQCA
jgi:hypothetical protein